MSIASMAAMPRHVWVLSVAQALSMTAINVNVINTGLVGSAIAPALWMATLPLSCQFLAAMMTTLPASLLMGRFRPASGFCRRGADGIDRNCHTGKSCSG